MATIDSMNRDTTRLSDGPDWTFELLETYLAESIGWRSCIVLTPIRIKSR